VVVRTQWSGTRDGPFLGLPLSGNKVRFSQGIPGSDTGRLLSKSSPPAR
jgi:hypothetical protein